MTNPYYIRSFNPIVGQIAKSASLKAEFSAIETAFDGVNSTLGYLHVSVADFAAVGDGTTDDTVAVQAALDSGALVVNGVAGKTYAITALTLPAGVKFDLSRSTLLGTANVIMLTMAGDNCEVCNGIIDCGNTQGATSVNTTKALYGVYADRKLNPRIVGVQFKRYRIGAVLASSVSGQKCTGALVSGCEFIAYDWPSTAPDNGQTGLYIGSTAAANNTVIGTFSTNWVDALDVSGWRVVGNRFSGGQYGIAVHRASDGAVTGNDIRETSRGISIQVQSRDIAVVGNTFGDNHTTGVHLSSGVRNVAVVGNVVTGTMANDNAAIQAYYGCQDILIAHNTLDSRFDQWAGGPFADLRSPLYGIRTGQMTRNIRIQGNSVRGYLRGIYIGSTIYPSAILPADPNYQNCGVKGVEVIDNRVVFDYEQLVASAVKEQFLQSNSYGVYVEKSGGWESLALGALGLDDVAVERNRIYDTNFPVVWQYAADTSGSPVVKRRLRSRGNRAVSSMGGNAEVFAGTAASADVDSTDNSWTDSVAARYTTFTPTATGLTVVLGAGSLTLSGKLWRVGERVRFAISIIPAGGATTASTLGSTTFTVGGLSPAEHSVALIANRTTGASLGTCSINTSGSPVVAPTWAATTNTFDIVGEFRL